jgi:uncharacterized protein
MRPSDDHDVVAVQIDRDPRGEVATAFRCEHGLPMVVRTSPTLETGEPFPTLYWLTCPLAVRAIGKLESTGTMRELNENLSAEPGLSSAYREAHERYREDRDGSLDGRDESAGGMPGRVKCLHALYAHELADANPIGELVRERIEPLGCPGPCVEPGENGELRKVPGHPAFARARR